MAKYRVLRNTELKPSGSGGSVRRLVRAGEVIEYDGVPGSSLLPLDAEARKRTAAALPQMHGLPSRATAEIRRALSEPT